MKVGALELIAFGIIGQVVLGAGIIYIPQLDEDAQRKAGVTPDFVRLSIGLEDIEDILWDLDQALSSC